MKTVYTDKRGKVVINDETLSLVEEAAQKVYQGSVEGGWRESIEIDIPNTRYESEDWYPGHPTGQLIIRVAWDSGLEDNVHTQLSRVLSGEGPRGFVHVDLGEYMEEGWESFIDHKDLRELPDVYFTEMFIHYIIEPSEISPGRSVQQVEAHCYKPLALKIYRHAREKNRFCNQSFSETDEDEQKDWYKKSISHLEYVMSVARDFYKGRLNKEQFVEMITTP